MALGFSAGSAYVDLVPRMAQGWAAGVDRETNSVTRRIAGKWAGMGKAIAIGLAGATIGLAAVGVSIGKTFDDAYDTIRLGTGATGEDLEDLKDSFKTVARDVPNDLGEVATAIADLNTRTGATGDRLESLATQTLTLSRIADEDLGTTIAKSTRLFGDWAIAADDQEAALDAVWRASQATGIGVSQLADNLVRYGAPLRQVGFTFEESAALIGQFEKEGVNANLVLGSIRQALGRMARDGEPAVETFRRVVGEIENAGSASEANAIALELFGARAGPDMAAAIREGRFEIGELVDQVANGGETILGAAEDTDDWAEKLQKLKNRAMVAAEPIATRLFDGVNQLLDVIEPATAWVGDRLPGALDRLRDTVAPVGDWLGRAGEQARLFFNALRTGMTEDEGTPIERLALTLRDTVIPVFERIAAFVRGNLQPILIGLGVTIGLLFAAWIIGAAAAAIATLAAAAVPLLIAAAIGAVVAGFIILYRRVEGFRNFVDGLVRWLKRNVPPAWEAIRTAAQAAFVWLQRNVPPIWERIRAGVAASVEWLARNVPPVWSAIQTAIMAVVGFLVTYVPPVLEGIRVGIVAMAGAIVTAWQWVNSNVVPIVTAVFGWIVARVGEAVDFVREVWPYISEIISTALGIARTAISAWVTYVTWVWNTFGTRIVAILQRALGFLLDGWRTTFNLLRTIVTVVFDQVRNIIGTVIGVVRGIITTALALITGDWSGAWEGIKSTLSTIWDGIKRTVENALELVKGTIEGLLDGISRIWSRAWETMGDVARGAWDGVTGAVRTVFNGILGILERGLNIGIRVINGIIDNVNRVPGVDISKLDEIEFRRLERGGRMRPGETAIVGDRGGDLRSAELFRAGPAGGRVFPRRTLEQLVREAIDMLGLGGAGIAFGDINVDARGLETPEDVADYISRIVAWRLTAAVAR